MAIISPNVRIRVEEHFEVGEHSIVDEYCYFSTRGSHRQLDAYRDGLLGSREGPIVLSRSETFRASPPAFGSGARPTTS